MKNFKTIEEMRDFLAEQMIKTASGEVTPAQTNSIANAAGKINQGLKLQIEQSKVTGQMPYIPFVTIKEQKKAHKKLEKR